ncbi:MAG: aminotransferase class V-fold PLP-dependent enzyme [Bacteriovorax sp.]|nr:aminotransferase class V-fold PLP-dependent enzyme [Bacteriovorax sp.]
MYKKYYSQFLTANPVIQHYSSHAHHYWPDVTRDATLQYWDDSAKYVDDKLSYIFKTKIPSTQKLIAETLNISCPEKIFFASNSQDLLNRLSSCFEAQKNISILTTDSESYSFDLQINHLAKDKFASIDKVSTAPFDDFEERFIEKIMSKQYDMIFLSHVFFNSGMVVKNLKKIVESVKNGNTIIVIDGSHGFMAIPTDLREIEDKIFYIAGSYEQGPIMEGCCFMALPERYGYKFAGATIDFTALYRLNAVLTLFKQEGLTVDKIHSHIQRLQQNFRNHLLEIDHHYLTEKNIISVDYKHHGHFLTFAMPSSEHAKIMHDQLKSINIGTDYIGSRLRFGFGIYQKDCIDLKALIKKL